jgi:GT2 family glycosyltransferase/glycosyltransferase involved in cell wall biosynthesis
MRTLGVRVVRYGIHEARRAKHVAKTMDKLKPYVHRKKSVIPKKAAFKTHGTYDVSIVIPVFSKKAMTLGCLASMSHNVSSDIRYQVIIINNNSTDGTMETIEKIPGLTYVHNDENLGFVDACNQGAALSNAKYLVFLNNDTRVDKGWLENLLSTIQREDVGLVGSKLVYPSEKLQEAGGIIFSDGSGHNYGRDQLPNDYKYNYVREVDYCSGASIIIERAFFNELGGFDRLYAPAYYEDTSLAFSVRKAGKKVLYQPKSVLYHVEGGTAGTNLNSGFKRFQNINKAKFEKKWAKELKQQPAPGEVYTGRDRSAQKLALIIDENLPKTDEDSGSIRMFRIIEAMQKLGYKVTFFPFNTERNDRYAEPLQQRGVEVVYGGTNIGDFLRENGKYYDTVMLSRPRIASFLMEFCRQHCTKAKIIYDTVDLHFLRLRRQAEYEPSPKRLLEQSAKLELIEKYLIEQADVTCVVSDVEQKILKQEGYETLILSNVHIIDEDSYKIGYDNRKDLLFIGGYGHPPNVDAIRWFATDIMPHIRAKLPDFRINVVGSHMPENLREFLELQPGVSVEGFVENLDPIFRDARVFVAPLRYGAGVKGKLGLAIEYGIPVVSTTVGEEGIHLKNGESCLVANEATEFAHKVVQLYRSPELWRSVLQKAKSVLQSNFSPEKTLTDLERILK